MVLLVELLKIIVPAAIVLYAMYLTIKSFINKELQKQVIDMKSRNQETLLPIKLQAFERMVLFLERITPNNLIRRLSESGITARQFQQKLLFEIREEFNHNLSQQVYMSDQSWNAIKHAMEEVIAIINQSAEGLPEDAKGIDLSKKILEKMTDENLDPTVRALTQVKNEIRSIF